MYCEHCDDGWFEVESFRIECPMCTRRVQLPTLDIETGVDDYLTRTVRVSALAGEVSS